MEVQFAVLNPLIVLKQLVERLNVSFTCDRFGKVARLINDHHSLAMKGRLRITEELPIHIVSTVSTKHLEGGGLCR